MREDLGRYWAGRMHGGKPDDHRAGVVWYIQCYSKSFTMLFFAVRMFRLLATQDVTLVVLTDRAKTGGGTNGQSKKGGREAAFVFVGLTSADGVHLTCFFSSSVSHSSAVSFLSPPPPAAGGFAALPVSFSSRSTSALSGAKQIGMAIADTGC